jgi:hypothetical protein
VRKQCLKLVKKLKTPKVRELLKKATKLKKQNKIEEAIRVLEEAYSVGELEPARSYSSFIVSSELDNYYTIEDLVRKSKYLQTAGKIDESLAFLDQIILETNKSAKNNIWEIFSLSSLYDYRSIILKKEKRYNEAFVSKIKYYCLDGIASFHRTGEEKKEKNYSVERQKNIVNIVKTKTNGKFILEFINSNNKKVDLKYDQRQLVEFIMKAIFINQNNVIIDIDNLLQSND